MPLTPNAVTQAILGADPTLAGPTWFSLARAIGSAVVIWVTNPANVVVSGVTTGAAGTGVVTGNLSVVPQPLPLSVAFLAADLRGVQAPLMASAIGFGVAISVTGNAGYRGVSAGVGTGTDSSKVTFANPATLSQVFTSVAAGEGLAGVQIPVLAYAIGTGIANLMLTGTGIGTVTGPAGGAPAVGTSLSSVF